MKERKAQEKTSQSENTENKENTENPGNESALLNMSTFSGFNVSSSVTIPGLDLLEDGTSPKNAEIQNNVVVNGVSNHRPTENEPDIQNGETQPDNSESDNAKTIGTNLESAKNGSIDSEMDTTEKIVEGDAKTSQNVDTEDDLNPHNFSPKLDLADSAQNDMSAESADDR
jgi:hypothetical protein